MKLVNWNIGSLKSFLSGKSIRAQQTRVIMKKIQKANFDWIGLQEVKIYSTGPTNHEIQALMSWFPGYKIIWNAAHQPSKTNYAGTMILYRSTLDSSKVIYPSIMPELDSEGRTIGLDLGNLVILNSYIPHYEYHNLRQHQAYINHFINFLNRVNKQKAIILAGDLTTVLANTTGQTTLSNKKLATFNDQYKELLKCELVDAYRIAPNGPSNSTWWAPNIPKVASRGMCTDFWLVSRQLEKQISASGPLDTGKRRDHAPIMLKLNNESFSN